MDQKSSNHPFLESWVQNAPGQYSTLSLGVALLNSAGIVVYHNPAFSHHFAIDIGMYLKDVVPKLDEVLNRVFMQGDQAVEWIWPGNTMVCITPIPLNACTRGALCCIYDEVVLTGDVSSFPEVKKLILERDAIIDSISEGVWVCDPDGIVIRVNPVSAKLCGVEPSDILGKSMVELEEENLFKNCGTLEAIKKKTTISRLVELKKSGIKALTTSKPIFDDDGNIIMIVGTERDITKLEALHQFLEEHTMMQESYQTKIKELQELHDISQTFIAKSKSMLQVLNHAIKVGKVNSTILILGESGVGKSAIADLIHKHSDRSQNQILGINCASIPESLIESELFGYEKGSFTGANDKGKAGLIEMAQGGTLFLDEIAELSLSSQSKLLKFLDEGSIRRIGSAVKLPIDVRIIAATNCNLEKQVTEGKFRPDLFYRLNVISIRIPPLRERNECVLSLIKYYINHFATNMKTKRILAPKTLEILLSYPYPGNIRELINICERIVVLTDHEYVVPDDLPQSIFRVDDNHIIESESIKENETLTELTDRVERAALIKARERFGSQKKMAKALGVTQPTINRKMKKHGLNSEPLIFGNLY
jgi:PAS domain S-box-containing protein